MTLTIGQGKLLAEGSTTVTVTNTLTGDVATVAIASSNGSNLPDPTTNQLVRISAADYADDAALRSDMWADDPGSFATGHKGYFDDATKTPTGSAGTARFPYMVNGDLITLDAVNTWRGKNTFRQRFPGSRSVTAQTITYLLAHDSIPNMESLWMKQVFRIDPTGTGGQPFFYGTGAGGIGYKQLSLSFNNYNGRYETEWEGGTPTGAALGTTSQPTDGSSTPTTDTSWPDAWTNGPSETAPFTNSKWYALIGLVLKLDANTQRVAWWYGPDDGSAPMVKQYDQTYTVKSAYRGAVASYKGLPQIDRIPVFGLNCNQTRSNATDVYINRADLVLFDPAVVTDPWGVLDKSGVTITSITPATLARGVSNQRVVVTGTNIDPNCAAVFSNAGITSTPDFSYAQSNRTHLVLSVSVDSGATPGAGTVEVTSSTEPDSGTLVFSVT